MKYFYKVVLFIVASLMSMCMIGCDKADNSTEAAEGNLVLTADDNSLVLKDGESIVINLSALYNDKYVMSSGKFALYVKFNGEDEVRLDAPMYEVDEVGTYTFYATYDFNNKQYVSEEEIVEVEAYVQPEYTTFRKRAIAVQFTGTWCGYCPSMIKLMHDYADDDKGEKVVFVVAHNGDNMANESSVNFVDYNHVSGFPTMRVGSIYFLGAQELKYSTINQAYTAFNNAVNNSLDEDAKTGIGASSTYNNSKIDVDVDIEIGQDGKYGVGVMVVEDDVYGKQENYYEANQLDLEGLDINYHDACLNISSPNQKPFYESFGDVEEHKANETYTYECSFAISDMTSMVDIENCRVVVYTYNIDTRKVDNIIELPVGESKDIEYLD